MVGLGCGTRVPSAISREHYMVPSPTEPKVPACPSHETARPSSGEKRPALLGIEGPAHGTLPSKPIKPGEPTLQRQVTGEIIRLREDGNPTSETKGKHGAGAPPPVPDV